MLDEKPAHLLDLHKEHSDYSDRNSASFSIRVSAESSSITNDVDQSQLIATSIGKGLLN